MDFALIMFVALVVTGGVWGADRLWFAPRRARTAADLGSQGGTAEMQDEARRESVLVEYARAFFPIILVVFMLRAFLVEPFRIPSGSMLPSLLIGDFILVNKFTYGVRLPILHRKVMDVNLPARGDVLVFRYPHETTVNYIKRVIGLPGDHIVYMDKQLYVNGAPISLQHTGRGFRYVEGVGHPISAQIFEEGLAGQPHELLLTDSLLQPPFEITVPAGQYFVMGDNRDRSNDSRYWGTVPESNIVGKAFLVWFSWNFEEGGVNWSRIGNSIL